MAEKRKEKQKFNTPIGVFKYPHLNKPDYGTKDYPKPAGEYNNALVLKLEDPKTQALLDTLKPLYDEAITLGQKAFSELKVDSRKALEKKNGKGGIVVNDLYKTLYDKETEEETGEIEFRFKMVASGVRKADNSKWSQKPDLFDARMNRIPSSAEIWGGTEGKVSFNADPYFIPGTGAVGLALKLKACQITKLVSSGERDAKSYGFGEEEGFSADDLPTQEDAAEDTVDGASDNAEAGHDF